MVVTETVTNAVAKELSRNDTNAIGRVVHVVKNYNDPNTISRVLRVVTKISKIQQG